MQLYLQTTEYKTSRYNFKLAEFSNKSDVSDFRFDIHLVLHKIKLATPSDSILSNLKSVYNGQLGVKLRTEAFTSTE